MALYKQGRPRGGGALVLSEQGAGQEAEAKKVGKGESQGRREQGDGEGSRELGDVRRQKEGQEAEAKKGRPEGRGPEP